MEKMKQIKNIILSAYNPDWPQLFEIEAQTIKDHIGLICEEIHHIGSTSVPGLWAKDDIDILCIVSDLKSTLKLQEIGFVFKGEINIPLRYYFSKNTPESKVNLHVCKKDNGFVNLNLTYRDYLRNNQDVRDAYAALKRELLQDPNSWVRVDGKFARYSLDKDVFIKNSLKEAGYKGLTYNFCLHDREWAAAEHLFGNTITYKESMTHMVLYDGIEIIGYAQIQPDQTFKVFMDANHINYKYNFINFIDLWIDHHDADGV